MGALSKLPNIGSMLESQLNQAGIMTEDDLKQVGAEQAWLRIWRFDASACMNRLLALEGAIQGIKKTFLSDARKLELRAFYQKHKKQSSNPA